MKAAVVEEYGRPPVYRDFDEPGRSAGQSLIEVTAAPLNPVDIKIASGSYVAGSPPLPYVAGREAVGRVLESDTIDAGTRVYVDGGSGGLAERVVAGDDDLIELPDGVEDALAGCFGVAGLAAWLALEWRGNLGHGETVLVLGASGAVGMIAVQAAKLLGAGRVVAAARSEKGLERARQLGADATVRLDGSGDLAERFVEAGEGQIQLTIDPLWGEPAAAAVRATAFGGRLVHVGKSASPEATFDSDSVRGRMVSVLGHLTPGAPVEVRHEAYAKMVRHAAAGDLTVDYELLPLARVADAWQRQDASPGRKLVLAPGDVR
jgi:NADPH:quinone reductase